MAALPRSLQGKRSVTSLEQERENFEKAQAYAVSKAINDIEVPVKVKHLRSVIIGTFQEKGSQTFWTLVLKLPLDGNPIVMWKFCHTLHKILREGHGKAIQEGCRFKHRIKELGKLWGHLKDGYGKLIAAYTSLLVSKLSFHQRNPRFPGNLMINDSDLEAICENDVNNYFQLSVEMFDYMDEILAFQAAVFGSLDMSRSNSMTNPGQCRLAPLIPCIQDSTQLYDFSVKLLFKLHNCLPSDTLVGHRDRFLKQFRALKQFYEQSSNLQYFKTLIQVPLLGDNPPNFLISSELSRHVTPVAILPPEREVIPQQAAADPVLVDFDSSSPDGSMADLSQRNGSISPDLLAERDRYIEHLLHQIEQMSAELERIRSEGQRQVALLRQRILDLEESLADKESELQEALKAKESIEDKLSQAAKSAEQGSVVQLQLQETEKRAKLLEEKFNKLKDVYQKLRDEHISLLRQKAETDKKLSVTNAALEQSNKAAADLGEKMENLEKQQQDFEKKIQSDAEEQGEKLRLAAEQKENVEKMKSELEEKVQKLEEDVVNLKSQFSNEQQQKSDLTDRFEQFRVDTEEKARNDKQLNFIRLKNLLVACASRAEEYLKNCVDDLSKPPAVVLAAQNESLNIGTRQAVDTLELLYSSLVSFFNSGDEDSLGRVIPLVYPAAQSLGGVLGQSRQLAHSLPDIEKADKLIEKCREAGNSGTGLFGKLQQELQQENIEAAVTEVKAALSALESMAETLGEDLRGGGKDDVGDQLEDELGQMERAIEEAAYRIAQLWDQSKEAYTGVKLEVNEKVLDSCTALMKAIRELITKAKTLQEEIVARGKGSASAKEFYKRNHRWTEGLLSAAKTVGFGAKLLVDAADKVVQGQAKFDQLTVASQEIAASTAQLVFASRVKADPYSPGLQQLSQASKGVSQATGGVVATAKVCAQMVEDSTVLDFGNLTLHQAKRLEMESQVKVLELESLLTKEQHRLRALRKQHYQLAGETEGWEAEATGQ